MADIDKIKDPFLMIAMIYGGSFRIYLINFPIATTCKKRGCRRQTAKDSRAGIPREGGPFERTK